MFDEGLGTWCWELNPTRRLIHPFAPLWQSNSRANGLVFSNRELDHEENGHTQNPKTDTEEIRGKLGQKSGKRTMPKKAHTEEQIVAVLRQAQGEHQ